eukprot:7206453-Alexandrium_andersonii.AAC.1
MDLRAEELEERLKRSPQIAHAHAIAPDPHGPRAGGRACAQGLLEKVRVHSNQAAMQQRCKATRHQSS